MRASARSVTSPVRNMRLVTQVRLHRRRQVEERVAADVRHVQVEHEHVDPARAEYRERRLTVLCHHRIAADSRQRHGERAADRRLVVDHEHPQAGARPRRPVARSRGVTARHPSRREAGGRRVRHCAYGRALVEQPLRQERNERRPIQAVAHRRRRETADLARVTQQDMGRAVAQLRHDVLHQVSRGRAGTRTPVEGGPPGRAAAASGSPRTPAAGTTIVASTRP